ncbi:MAG: hypothetical protein KJ666_02000 [Bacteroidetes bacterium]|nr:hypothetical protein [Bacteroidota bacterium]MBU2584286.1 hypothetical protein [Bacteroidota bacterium]
MNKKFFAHIILIGFAFLFAHSELGFFEHNKEVHDTHDYCNLVKSAKVEKTTTITVRLNDNFDYLIVCNDCFLCTKEFLLQEKNLVYYKLKQETPTFILNRTLLI